MIKSNKLEKAVIVSVGAIALLMAGGNPAIQNTIQSADNHIEMPTSHADNSNKFNLSKRITTKQFTGKNTQENTDKHDVTDSRLNKKISKRVDKYLRSVNNLSDYHVHISRITTSASQGSHLDDSETATITFTRK